MGFEYERFKVQVKLAVSRITTLQQKHQNSLCGRRREVADLLKNGQDERARLLVKYLIRDDYLSEVYDIVQMMCDDLHRSALAISQEKKCDDMLAPIVKSIIYAAGRIDVPELVKIKEQLVSKYGKSWGEMAAAGADQRLVLKLAIRNPDNTLVNKYLLAIAEIYNIPWAPPAEEEDLLARSAAPSPVNVAHPAMAPGQVPPPMMNDPSQPDMGMPTPIYPPLNQAYPPPPPYAAATGVSGPLPGAAMYTHPSSPPHQHQPSQPPSMPPTMPGGPSVPPTTPSPGAPQPPPSPGFDDLAKRFEALRKK